MTATNQVNQRISGSGALQTKFCVFADYMSVAMTLLGRV